MKKFLRIFVAIIMVFASIPLVSCKDKCEHTYALTGLSVETDSKIDKPGIYTCSTCGKTKTESVTYKEIGMPVLDLIGSLEGVTKYNELNISVAYNSEDVKFEADAKIKCQGATSLGYDKKNYNIKFYKSGTNYEKKEKIEMVSGWGKQYKYCLKANWIDYSQARNVVSGQLYSQVVHEFDQTAEPEKNYGPYTLYNGGCVDGFPVVLYLNGDFFGVYTFNIPKDKWMFGMEDDDLEDDVETRHAALMAEHWSDSTALKTEVSSDFISSGWELEHCSTEETSVGTGWVIESFNNLINFLNNNEGQALKDGLGTYLDIDRAIDVMLFTNFIYAEDNISKNIVWLTYDGVKWLPSMYDMDGCLGINWDGSISSEEWGFMEYNEVFVALMQYYRDDVVQRYKELRSSVLKYSNVETAFKTFFNKIPEFVRTAEKGKWGGAPSYNVDHYSVIMNFVKIRLVAMDEKFIFV